jgi:hypothetical protein
MKGILMGCHIMDMHGTPLTFVIPHEYSDPLLSDSLISAGRLMEAGFGAIFRISQNAVTDGINPATYPIHGGTILTPEQPPRTIIIEYQGHLLLPVPTIWKHDERLLLFTFNPFSPLCCDPEALSPQRTPDDAASSHSEIDQRKFKLMCKRQKQAQILHESGGHRNARDTFRDLEAPLNPKDYANRDYCCKDP